jgi:Cu-Zn family superoxide dismutase
VLLLPASAWADAGRADIRSPSGNPDLQGEVILTDTPSGLLIQGSLIGAAPGLHGFHIHEFGDCADGGNAAGGHYNPQSTQHGNLVTEGFTAAHAGDLGNIKVAEDGTAAWLYTLSGLTLSGSEHPVAGRAFIVHANPDDFGQPAGNAGSRIGCGAIFLVKQPPAAH